MQIWDGVWKVRVLTFHTPSQICNIDTPSDTHFNKNGTWEPQLPNLGVSLKTKIGQLGLRGPILIEMGIVGGIDVIDFWTGRRK